MNNDLNMAKQFESTLKKYLLEEFGTYLPEDKVSLLNNTNYLDDNVVKETNTDYEIRGTLARNMLRDLINVECYKEFPEIAEINSPIPYGQNLENALIEYYAKRLADKYGFNINEIPELKDSLETMKILDEKLNNSLDSMVFTQNAMELLRAANFKELIEKEDKAAIEKFLEKSQKLASLSGETEKKDLNDISKEYFEREGSIQFVWINEKKNLKYIDLDGKVHLIEIEGLKQTNEFIKNQLATVGPNKKLNPELFFSKVKELVDETTLRQTDEIKQEELNYEEVDMLQFIKSNEKIKTLAEEKHIEHNPEMTTHVIEKSKDIVQTEDKSGYVEAKIIKDGNAEMTEEAKQDMNDISSRLLTEEEVKELTDKYARGDNLTKEELEALRRTYEYYRTHGIEAPVPELNDEKGAVLLPESNKNNYYGFTNKTMVAYIVILALFICATITLVILASLKK